MTIKLFYNNGKVFSNKNFKIFTNQSIKTFNTILTISSGSSVSGNGVTLSGTNGSRIGFNQVQSINNPLDFTDIRIYINSLYIKFNKIHLHKLISKFKFSFLIFLNLFCIK